MPEHPALTESRQLLLVVSAGWEAPSGTLYRYERAQAGAAWHLRESFPVSLGRTGLAWGLGLHGAALSAGPVKREGDGKSPAGIFALGPAFGYAPVAESGVHDFSYVQVTENTFGIEDPASVHYNTIVDATRITPDWKAADHMLRPDGLYQRGVFVRHNPAPGPQDPALGSCIFLHLWRGPGQPTAGCTAMRGDKIAALTAWLREACQPRLVQLTAPDYHRFQKTWVLPELAARASSPWWLVWALLAGLAAGFLLRRRSVRA